MMLSSGEIFLHRSLSRSSCCGLFSWGKNTQLILFIRYEYQHKCVEFVHEVYILERIVVREKPGGVWSFCLWLFMILLQEFYQWLSHIHVCVTVRNKTEWSINLCSGVCVCVCVHSHVCKGHSTVPYIKLSASWHCRMNKWSPMAAGGGVVSRLWIKSVPSSRSLMLGILCPCVLLCRVFMHTVFTVYWIFQWRWCTDSKQYLLCAEILNVVHRCTNADHDWLRVIQVSVLALRHAFVIHQRAGSHFSIRPLVLVDFAAFNDTNTKRLYAFVPASIHRLFFVPFSPPGTIHRNKDLTWWAGQHCCLTGCKNIVGRLEMV